MNGCHSFSRLDHVLWCSSIYNAVGLRLPYYTSIPRKLKQKKPIIAGNFCKVIKMLHLQVCLLFVSRHCFCRYCGIVAIMLLLIWEDTSVFYLPFSFLLKRCGLKWTVILLYRTDHSVFDKSVVVFVWPQLPLLTLVFPMPKRQVWKFPLKLCFKQLMKWFHRCWWLKNLTLRHLIEETAFCSVTPINCPSEQVHLCVNVFMLSNWMAAYFCCIALAHLLTNEDFSML